MKQHTYDRKLKNFLINKGLQLRIILHSLLYMVVVVCITIAIILYPLIRDMMFSQSLDTQYRAAQTFITLGYRLIPALLVVLILMFLHLIVLTHRICGPIINFSHTFKSMARGNITRKVYLRKGDYLIQESHLINEMTDGIAELIHKAKIDTDTLIHSLENFRIENNDPNIRNAVDQALTSIKDQAVNVRTDLSIFKT